MKKSDFLLSSANKQASLYLLGEYLEGKGMAVRHAPGDADFLIVKTAVECAESGPTVLIGEDNDLLMMALVHYRAKHDLFLTSEPKDLSKPEVWNIGKIKVTLMELVDGLLVIHAFSGCDTTSRIHGIGKGAVLKKYVSSKRFQKAAKVFMREDATREEICFAGEEIMLVICGATKREKSMDDLRLVNYYKKLEGKSAIKPELLGPTSDATHLHSLRVYLQVQAWL